MRIETPTATCAVDAAGMASITKAVKMSTAIAFVSRIIVDSLVIRTTGDDSQLLTLRPGWVSTANSNPEALRKLRGESQALRAQLFKGAGLL